MCEIPCDYNPLACPEPNYNYKRPFTVLLLRCWQNEYDKRPYRNFQFRVLDFMERMGRNFHNTKDFHVIVSFLHRFHQHSVSFWGNSLVNQKPLLLRHFVTELERVRKIELKLHAAAREFFVMLRMSAPRMIVTHLSLESTQMTDDDVVMLREFLLTSPTLRSLNVNSCNITQYNFALIADGVYKSAKVSEFNCSRILGLTLTLDTQKITATLASVVWQNRLVDLIMEQCEFTAQDMEIIAEYLHRKESKLRKLSFAYNLISADGTKYLMKAIAHSSTLEFLDISCNSIGTHGGEWISKYLSSCKMLQYLYLNYNEIGAEAINSILTTMKKPIKLLKLNLYGNNFNSKTAKIVRRLIDSRVVPQDTIDLTYTFDDSIPDYRIIPWR